MSLKPLPRGSAVGVSKYRSSIQAYTPILPVCQNVFAGSAPQTSKAQGQGEVTLEKQGLGSSMNQNAESVFINVPWSPILTTMRKRSVQSNNLFLT